MGASEPGTAGELDEAVLLSVLSDVKKGDFSVRMPLDWTGVPGKIADRLNDVIAANETLGAELARVSRVVGKEGKLSQRVAVGGGSGRVWAESIESVNSLIDDLVRPTSEMQRVIGAVAGGDLSKKITADVEGEVLELKNTINAMVDQLNRFVSEVTRVAREVGTEGKLGQAAAVTIEVGGVWKDLTDNVNLMAGNLTGQVRNIAEVTTAVANGDLSKKISADVKGEFLELKNTVNAMVDQLNRFASEVTRVAREVGVEGKLGGQAQSAEVAGVWKDLTDNVNQLAANLTNQVRAIADVATAVTEGDLTRQVGVEASGEVAVLKDKLNEMIRNLRETTRQNTEQDWLKTNLERFTRMLQGQRDLATVSSMILSELAPLVSAQHGVFYTLDERTTTGGEPVLRYQAGYGYKERKHLANEFRLGEGLVGQCAREKQRILLTDVPGDYVTHQLRPRRVLAAEHHRAADPLRGLGPRGRRAGVVQPLQRHPPGVPRPAHREHRPRAQHDRGQHPHREPAQPVPVPGAGAAVQGRHGSPSRTPRSSARTRRSSSPSALVEEKAEQLAVSSKYKSEFFSNMSHELRTPLNSLLILAGELKDNPDENLTEAQVQYASVIHSSGTDLLRLLNDILDLAKVESGTVALERPRRCRWTSSRTRSSATSGHVAEQKGLGFSVELAPDAAGEHRDRRRPPAPGAQEPALERLQVHRARRGDRAHRPPAAAGARQRRARAAGAVIAISVTDTGIGITAEMQQRIFEAFAQADGTTARQYGGTGLGLSISRELVRLLGGEIALTSAPDEGSTFTVYLPSTRAAPARRRPCWTAPPTSPRARRRPCSRAGARPTSAGARARGHEGAGDRRRLPQHLRASPRCSSAAGSRSISAESGEEGARDPRRTPDIDIVLVDIMMPVMDGYATMRAMRKLPRREHLPIIALTANVGPGERQRCIDAGASAYVPKPVETARTSSSILGEWLPAAAPPRKCCGRSRSTMAVEAPSGARSKRRGARRRRQRPPSASRCGRCSRRSATSSSRPTRAAPRCARSCASTFAVILMDVRMPTLDGYETAELIRQRHRVGAHADHLRHRVRPRRDRDGDRVRQRRRRLHLHADARRRAAGEGRRPSSTCSCRPRSSSGSLDSITALNAALRDSEVRARAVLQNVADGIVTAGEGGPDRVVQPVGAAAVRLPRGRGDRRSRSSSSSRPSHHDDFSDPARARWSLLTANDIPAEPTETVGCRKDGSCFPMEMDMSQMQIGERTFTIGCIRDISGRKAYTEALEHRALHDDLTGLPNRALFGDRMDRAIAVRRARRASRAASCSSTSTASAMINETLGRESGDVVLKTVAERLRGPRCATRTRWRAWAATSSASCASDETDVETAAVDRLEGPRGVRAAVPDRAARSSTCARASGSPSSRSTAARPPTCCAAPIAGDAPGQGVRQRPRRLRRRAGGPDRAPADPAERAARRHPARRARAALPAQGRPDDAHGRPASRRSCAGSTRPTAC